jgi:putative membrane protein
MIVYDPKSWLTILCTVRGTVLTRVLGRVAFITAVAVAVLLWDRCLSPIDQLDPLGHSLLGVALGMLIVLRTNSSYDRWWEGRKLWGGVVNSGRNLVRTAATNCREVKDLVDLVTAHAISLRHHLHGDHDLSGLKSKMSPELYERVTASANPPAVLAFALGVWIKTRQAEGRLESAVARQLDGRVNELLEAQGHCERILHTPMPFAYAVHIKQMLMLYLMSLPLLLVPKMGIPALFVIPAIGFGLIGVEEAGIEIEDPFGDDPNDLPLDDLCATIAADAAEFAALAMPPLSLTGRQAA